MLRIRASEKLIEADEGSLLAAVEFEPKRAVLPQHPDAEGESCAQVAERAVLEFKVCRNPEHSCRIHDEVVSEIRPQGDEARLTRFLA